MRVVPTILVSAGDLSGDRHAADLVRAVRARLPEARFVGMGGAAMAAAGVEVVVDGRELAVGGFTELVGSLGRIGRAWRAMSSCIRKRRPDLIVLVDSGGFHLPLARRARRLSGAPILYYVAPQAWAWREHRARTLAARADRVAVILPFEKEFYEARGIEVEWVGHPLVDRASDAVALSDDERRRVARERLGLDPEVTLVGLFPGSRRNELGPQLSVQLEACERLRRDRPGFEVVVALAPTLDRNDLPGPLDAASESDAPIHVVEGRAEDVMDAVDVALARPGTVTLELMLRDRPMVVCGRVGRWTAWIARRSLRIPFLALPNLVANEPIVPECLQEGATGDRIAAAAAPLFEGEGRARQLDAFALARDRLGGPGAAARTAGIVEEMLGAASA